MSVKRKPGTDRWQARWRDPDGRQRARTFPRRADAVAHIEAVQTDRRRGVLIPTAGNLTVADMATRWLDGARKLTEGGRDTYRRDLDRYILPELGDLPLDRLTADRIDSYLTRMQHEGGADGGPLAASTVSRHYRTLHRMLKVAVDRGYLAANPCAKVEPPRGATAEMRFLDVDQVDQLADAIGARYQAWIYVAAYCGLRWSETVGLQRRRVEGNRISVVEQLLYNRDGSGWRASTPKTKAGQRTVTAPSFVAEILEQHLAEHVAPEPEALVFTNAAGNPMMSPSFTTRHFKPALERAGLDRRTRIHDLRHTACALAIQAGAHPKAIQARLGHASIAITLDRYGHLFPAIDEDLAVGLDQLRSRP